MNVGLVLGGVLAGWWAAQGMKTPTVRSFDVVALGPYLIALGTRPRLSSRERHALQLAGALTIGYNARNLLENL